MAGTEGKCDGQHQNNFIVSGLDDKEFDDFCTTLKYLPNRGLGVGCISKKQYDAMTTSTLGIPHSEPHYTESWVVNLEDDMLGCLAGHLTHGKTYEVLEDYNGSVYSEHRHVVLNDSGVMTGYYHSWFTPVKLYDEDESELVCRDIEFNKGDWFDLSKHTPEQIRHIAKFYCFYNVDGLLEDPMWTRIYYGKKQFIGTSVTDELLGKEYHFNDLFYLEGE